MEMEHITIRDDLPLATEEDFRETAKELGISYEDYLKALDKCLYITEDILEFVEKLHNN